MEGAKGPRLRDFLSGSLATWVRVRWDSWERKRVSEQTEGWGRGGWVVQHQQAEEGEGEMVWELGQEAFRGTGEVCVGQIGDSGCIY